MRKSLSFLLLICLVLWLLPWPASAAAAPDKRAFTGKLINHGSRLFLGSGDFRVLKNFRYYENGIGTRAGTTVYTADNVTVGERQIHAVIPFAHQNQTYLLAVTRHPVSGTSLWRIESGSFGVTPYAESSGLTTDGRITWAVIRDRLVYSDGNTLKGWAGVSDPPTALLVEYQNGVYTDRFDWIHKDSHNVVSGNTVWIGSDMPFSSALFDKDDAALDSGVGVSSVTPEMVGGQYRYWAHFVTTGTSSIELPTLQTTPVSMTNFWAGDDRVYPNAFLFQKTGASEFQEYTGFVADESTEMYADISEMESGGTIAYGFRVPVREISVSLPEDFKNETLSVSGISYFNGTGYTALSNFKDGTSHNGACFAQSGTYTYDKATDIEKTTLGENPEPLYYYTQNVNATIDSYVRIYKATGLPDDDSINEDGYNGVVGYQGKRAILYNGKDPSILKISAELQPYVYNGSDSIEYAIGNRDKVVCAVPVDNGLIVFKETSGVYFFEGVSSLTYTVTKLDDVPTCVAPESARVVSYDGKRVVIYEAFDGVYLLATGGDYRKVSGDIRAYWDKDDTLCIPASWLKESVAMVDYRNTAYQLLIASGSGATCFTHELVWNWTLNKWSVFERDNNALLSTLNSYRDSNSDILYLGGGYDGTIYELDTGSADTGYTIVSDLTRGDRILGDSEGYNHLRGLVLYYELMDGETSSGITIYVTPKSNRESETTYTVNSNIYGHGYFLQGNMDIPGFLHRIRLRFPKRVYLFREIDFFDSDGIK